MNDESIYANENLKPELHPIVAEAPSMHIVET